jgi:hypothetical protein
MGHMPSSLKAPILPSEAEARMAAEIARRIAARPGEGAILTPGGRKEGRSRAATAGGCAPHARYA